MPQNRLRGNKVTDKHFFWSSFIILYKDSAKRYSFREFFYGKSLAHVELLDKHKYAYSRKSIPAEKFLWKEIVFCSKKKN